MKRFEISYILMVMVVAAVVSGCSDDMPSPVLNDNWASDEYFIIGSGSSTSSMSRVTYENEYKSVFEDGDVVGGFSFDSSGAVIDSNVPMKVETRTNLNTGQTLQTLVPQGEKVLQRGTDHYLFYYPYSTSMTIEKARNYTHTVLTDQSVDSEGAALSTYEQSDLLWDNVRPEGKNVHIIFDHAMANILVMVPVKELEYYESVTIHGQPLTATKIDLSAPELNDMDYIVATDQEYVDITMSSPVESTRENDQNEKLVAFRAAVPACRVQAQASDEDDAFITVNYSNNTTKRYRLKKDMELKPGRNYYFTISSFTPPVIDVDDDDSWVLEVYDSENDLVGYLCREYILYVSPDSQSEYRSFDPEDYEKDYSGVPSSSNNLGYTSGGYITSTNPGTAHDDALWKQIFSPDQFNNPTTSGKVGINSQAWVFYNLHPGTKAPDLTQGTVLRFIYDIKSGAGKTGYTPIRHPKYCYDNYGNYNRMTPALWPLPHQSKPGSDSFQGLFKVAHGHEYLASWQTGLSGWDEAYGYESPEGLEYYMHGGTLIWNGGMNFIEDFVFSEEMVTNEQAYLNGHIAIKKENGVKTAFVSYTPLTSTTTDMDGNDVGYTIIKYMDIGDQKYPLRKVSFNQFWTGRSLNSTVDRDGKPLECYNITESEYDAIYNALPEEERVPYRIGAVKFESWAGSHERLPHETIPKTEKLQAGFIYPTGVKGESISDMNGAYDSDIDPVNNQSLRKSVALLYNFTAFTEDRLKPADTELEAYRFPTWGDIARMRRYGGYGYPAKWLTDEVKTKRADGTYVETDVEAIEKGMIFGSNAYCANISGLDLRAFGFRNLMSDKVEGVGERCYIFLDATEKNFFYNLKPEDEYSIEKNVMNWMAVFCFNPWNAWDASGLSNYRPPFNQKPETGEHIIACHSQAFAAVRVVMSFKEPVGIASRSMRRMAPLVRRENPYQLLPMSEIK